MEALASVLPVLMYILGSILLVVLIILGIKLIQTVDRANIILDDLEQKSKSLNGIFSAVENFSSAIAVVGDRVVEGITGMISSFFHKIKKRRSKKEEIEDYE